MIMEAVSIKVQVEDARAEKEAKLEAERRDFTNTRNPDNFTELDKYR